MNDESKLAHSWAGTVISWVLTLIAWFGTHMAALASLAAIVAAGFSVWASYQTGMWRREQRKKLDDSE